MTIKTWKERLEDTAHKLPSGALHTSVEEIADAMQEEIDELRAENLKQDEEYVEQGLRLIQLEKRLEAWEKQEPVGYLAWYQGQPAWNEDCVCKDAVYPVDEFDSRTSEPLYTKPKEQS